MLVQVQHRSREGKMAGASVLQVLITGYSYPLSTCSGANSTCRSCKQVSMRI